jgi:histone-lysine N-methyltransferase SETMAR
MMKIHIGNCEVHTTPETWQKMRRMKFRKLSHPPYSPDLSPCDFWSFGQAKIALRDQNFADADSVFSILTDLFDWVIFEELGSVFQSWIEKLKWVIWHNGEYFIK